MKNLLIIRKDYLESKLEGYTEAIEGLSGSTKCYFQIAIDDLENQISFVNHLLNDFKID